MPPPALHTPGLRVTVAGAKLAKRDLKREREPSSLPMPNATGDPFIRLRIEPSMLCLVLPLELKLRVVSPHTRGSAVTAVGALHTC